MPGNGQFERAPVLDPVERITEVIFGLLMAMTFTGTISVATADQAAERTMMLAALGCNLAWGLADAVMYLLRALVERTRRIKLYLALRNGADAAAAVANCNGGRQRGPGAVAPSAARAAALADKGRPRLERLQGLSLIHI